MRIIKHPDSHWTKNIQCDCEAVFEIEKSDVKFYHYYHGKYYFYIVNCPCCDKDIRLTDLPERITTDARNAYYGCME